MICQKCGAVLREGTKFCESCGAAVEFTEEAPETNSGWDDYNSAGGNAGYGSNNSGGYGGGGPSGGYGGGAPLYPVQQRSIAVCIILSLITCGIYSLYWIYVLNQDVNSVAGEEPQTGGGMVILLGLITCGIYWWFWLYKMGEKVQTIKSNNGLTASSDAVLYLVLAIFGLSIIDLALMQDTVNKYGA